MIFKIEKGFYLNTASKDVIIEVVEVIKDYLDKVHCTVIVRNKSTHEIIKEGPMFVLKDNYRNWFYLYHG
jgi:hypothetical protein